MLDPNIYPKICKIICCVRSLIIINLGMVFSVTGCAPVLRVLPPTIYDTNNGSIYDSLSPELKTTAVDVFYFTDRQPKTNESEVRGYGDKRSSRLAYGLARVELGDWQNWDELVDWTLSSGQATGRLAPRLVGIEEKGQFPETPYLYSEDASGHVSLNPEIKREINLAVNNTRRELQSRLALTPVKDVFLYIHGIQTSFEKAVTHAAVYDHFTGRSGVSIAY